MTTDRKVLVGDFSEEIPSSTRGGVNVALTPRELIGRWNRCGLTADWLSSYLVHDFEPAIQESAKNILSTVANELLENAVKFSLDAGTRLEIDAYVTDDSVWLETRNAGTEERARLLENTLRHLDAAATDVLFARRIADGSAPHAPGIGLIIIKRDYGASVGAELTPHADGTWLIHVIVEVPLSALRNP